MLSALKFYVAQHFGNPVVPYINTVFSSVQSLSRVQLFATHESQHARPPCPSPTPGVHSNSRPLSQ